MKSKILIILLIAMFSANMIYSNELIDRYFNEAKSYYLVKDYERAYARIKFVLRNFTTYEAIPLEIALISEKIYYDYIESITAQGDETKLIEVLYRDNNYTIIASKSNRLQGLKTLYEQKKDIEERQAREQQIRQELIDLKNEQGEQFNRQFELQLEEQQRSAEIELQQKQLEYERFLQVQEQANRERIEFESRNQEQLNRILETTLVSKDIEAQANRKNVIILIVSISAIVAILFVLFFLIIFVVMKNTQKQQERMFEFQMQNLQITTASILNLPQLGQQRRADPSMMIVDNSEQEKPVLDGPATETVIDINLADELKEIIETCEVYAEAIDEKSGRKNASKNVAEIVYKISKNMQFDDVTCMLYYAIALVHDIGFLEVDGELFEADSLTEEQIAVLKTHTTLGLGLVDFVPEEYKSVFRDGISKHHENLNGSGYPRGLFSDQIPMIARIIRVVESYMAIISLRVYKEIKDKLSAIDELNLHTDKYDAAIVKQLEQVI